MGKDSTKDKIEYIIKDYQSNMSAFDMEIKYGVSMTYIRRLLRRRGIPKRPQGNATNIDFFDEINTESKAYWYGFFLADGYIMKSNYGLSILLAASDVSHLEKFALIFGSKIDFKETPSRVGNYSNFSCRTNVWSTRLGKAMTSKGLTNRKTYDLTPEALSFIPQELLRHCVRGFFDGDGCVYFTPYGAGITFSGCKPFLEGLKDIIFNECGAVFNIYKGSNTYALTATSFTNRSKFFPWLYRDATVWLERKRKRFDIATSNDLIRST